MHWDVRRAKAGFQHASDNFFSSERECLKCCVRFRVATATAAVAPATATAAVAPGTDLYGDPLPPGAITRLGTTRFRVPGGGWLFHSMAFLPDNKTIVGIADYSLAEGARSFCGIPLRRKSQGTLQLWNLAEGKEAWRQVLPDNTPRTDVFFGRRKAIRGIRPKPAIGGSRLRCCDA